jgi:acetyl-CoA acyltransferase
MPSAFVYDFVRTPFGKIGGALAAERPDDLAALVVRALIGRSETIDPGQVDEVVFGNANGAGEENRNVARMAVLLAGMPVTVPATTVNRLCGSSMDAAMMASRQIEVGEADLMIVGGVESMSRAPWVLRKPERTYPAGNATLESTTLGWRLVNPRMEGDWTVSLGEATERLADRQGVSRERQDAFAVRSQTRAAEAWSRGWYDDWTVTVPGVELDRDETVRDGTTIEGLAGLRTVFRSLADGGTVTAGNASPMSDGASAVLLGSESASDALDRAPLARIAGRAAAANEPQFFGYAPVEAANRAIERAGIAWADVGAVELNEAFAAQSLACIESWPIDPEVVNRWGGALAIGHPLGASGGRVLGTLAARMHAEGVRYGVASLCIGVGQALAVVLERVEEA